MEISQLVNVEMTLEQVALLAAILGATGKDPELAAKLDQILATHPPQKTLGSMR